MSSKPRTRAILTGLIAVAAGLTLAGCSLLGPSVGTQTDDGVITDVFTIKVGDCLNDASAGEEVLTVPTVDCSEPHDSEAYLAFNLDEGSFPGDEAVTQAAYQGCDSGFADFVGVTTEQSKYDWAYYFPTAQTWAQGDREILCLVIDPTGEKMVGSMSNVRE